MGSWAHPLFLKLLVVTMRKNSRRWIGVAAGLLLLAYILPIWKITLDAPQYPEGIGMLIQIDTIEGVKEHDLQNINGLNHYIGMKTIEPDDIPELKIMPFIIAGLIVIGVATALAGRRWLLYTWVLIFLIISIVGMVDFYLWEYDYGHNLDQVNAIIKIPGMNYQPPLLGSKQILNFTAHSWPGAGGWAVISSLLIGFVTAISEFRNRKS
jgi:copper chaperone NosL